MQKQAFYFLAIMVIVLTASPTSAAPVVIAGSSLESPPPFWDNSYCMINASYNRAFQFAIISGGPYYAEELQVAAFYHEGIGGSVANFSINLDDDGQPGLPVGTFEMSGIATTPQIVTAQVTDETVLYSDTLYWLVGQTPQADVLWNLADNVFGTVAYRVDQNDWVILPSRNVSAFAILGSQVPEPATFVLLALAGLGLIKKHTV